MAYLSDLAAGSACIALPADRTARRLAAAVERMSIAGALSNSLPKGQMIRTEMGGRCSYVPLAGQQMRAPARSSRVVIKKPATKERAGINPFTKEPTVFKARPARKIVRVRPVKAAKDAV